MKIVIIARVKRAGTVMINVFNLPFSFVNRIREFVHLCDNTHSDCARTCSGENEGFCFSQTFVTVNGY